MNNPTNYCAINEPTIVAHRGASGHYPENSLAAVKEAINIAMRAPELSYFIELDIRQSANGALVCMHDVSTNRTMQQSGNVSDFSLAQLQKMPMKTMAQIAPHASPKPTPAADQFLSITAADLRVPSVDEVLELVKHANQTRTQNGAPIGLALEVKAQPVLGSELVTQLLRGLVNALRFIGLGKPAAAMMPTNPTVQILADTLNNNAAQQGGAGLPPLMLYATGMVGLRDVTRLKKTLNKEAKQAIEAQNGMLFSAPRAIATHALEGFSELDKLATSLVNNSMSFWYIGQHTSCPEHGDMRTAPVQLFRPINHPEMMQKAIAHGVTLIASDYPDRLVEALHKQRAATQPDETQTEKSVQPSRQVQQAQALDLLKQCAPELARR